MDREWWQGAVVYQVYPLSFFDSDGDGYGDLAGVLAKLDHIAGLGVDAIWLAPCFVSPMADFGYDVADYCDVDPRFGSLADLDRLIAACHGRGLKLLLDMVWCHTSDRHQWFIESRSTRDNPRADWYVWADPQPDGTPPNNWLSVFGGSAWRWDTRRRQYYLHHFLKSQPQLNTHLPAVIEALLEVGRFWLERGVDGFRFDAIDYLVHDPKLTDNPPRTLDRPPARPFLLQRHLHDMAQPAIDGLTTRIRALLDRYPGRFSIAEVGNDRGGTDALTRGARYSGADRLHSAYILGVIERAGNAAALRRTIAEVEATFPDGRHCWCFSNHDVVRVASRWGDGSPAAAKLFLALLLTLRGTAILYQGEELGLPEAALAPEERLDPFGHEFYPAYLGRDGCRTPMPWEEGAANLGFSTGPTTWLPVQAVQAPLSLSAQASDPASPLAICRWLLGLRKGRSSLRAGDLTLIDTPEPVLAYTRRSDTDGVLCAFNLSATPTEVPALPGTPLPDCPFAHGRQGDRLSLPPWGVYLDQIAPQP